MFDFKGKSVLITGASYGLGEQFAYAFADAGADLISRRGLRTYLKALVLRAGKKESRSQ